MPVKKDLVLKLKNLYQFYNKDIISFFCRKLEIVVETEGSALAWVEGDKPVIHYNCNFEISTEGVEDPKVKKSIKDTNKALTQKSSIVLTLIHEALHLYLNHAHRAPKNANYFVWNLACECEINEFLKLYGDEVKATASVNLSTDKAAKWFDAGISAQSLMRDYHISIQNTDLAEVIYDKLMAEVDELMKALQKLIDSGQLSEGNASDGSMSSPATVSIGKRVVTLGSYGGGLEESPDIEGAVARMKKEAEYEERIGSSGNKNKGSVASSRLRELNLKITKEKRLAEILRKVVKKSDAKLSKGGSLVTWQGFNSFYRHVAKRPVTLERDKKINTLYLVVDESGSMSDTLLIKMLGIIYGTVKKSVVLSRLVLIHHDVGITVDKTNINDIKFERKNQGGTSHHEVFKYLKEKAVKDDMAIFLTDLYSDIESNWNILKSIGKKLTGIWIVEKDACYQGTKNFLKNQRNQKVVEY